jgi:hypothetical protein
VQEDDRALLSIEQVGMALYGGGQVIAGRGLEAEHGAAGTNELEAEEEPLAQIEGRSRGGGVVIARGVVFDASGEGIEVGELELASGGPEERMLLVNGLERREGAGGETDGGDDDREASAGADIEDGAGRTEMGNGVEAIADVDLDLLGGAGGREVDAPVPLEEEVLESMELFEAARLDGEGRERRDEVRHEGSTSRRLARGRTTMGSAS